MSIFRAPDNYAEKRTKNLLSTKHTAKNLAKEKHTPKQKPTIKTKPLKSHFEKAVENPLVRKPSKLYRKTAHISIQKTPITYQDNSVPQYSKPVKYPAPAGLVEREIPQSTKTAWEKSHSYQKLAEKHENAKIGELKARENRAVERGERAIQKERVERAKLEAAIRDMDKIADGHAQFMEENSSKTVIDSFNSELEKISDTMNDLLKNMNKSQRKIVESTTMVESSSEDSKSEKGTFSVCLYCLYWSDAELESLTQNFEISNVSCTPTIWAFYICFFFCDLLVGQPSPNSEEQDRQNTVLRIERRHDDRNNRKMSNKKRSMKSRRERSKSRLATDRQKMMKDKRPLTSEKLPGSSGADKFSQDLSTEDEIESVGEDRHFHPSDSERGSKDGVSTDYYSPPGEDDDNTGKRRYSDSKLKAKGEKTLKGFISKALNMRPESLEGYGAVYA